MAKTTYLGANVEVTTDSFGGWINKTNQVIYDMGTVVLTAGLVAQPNSTNGAEVTGNSHVEGIFSANTIVAVDSLRGGTVSTPANLVITTNTVFQQSNLVDIQANTNLFNVDANNVVISSNVTLDGGSTKDFTATLGDITTTSTLFDITATTFNLTGTSTIDGPILNVDTTDLDVTANTLFTAATLSANVTTVDIDYITFNLDGTTFNHTSQDITVDTNTATVNATTIDITTTDFSAIAESVSLISNTAVANVSVLDVNSTTITVDGNTTISGTTSTINANTTVNGSTVNVNANTTITGSNVDIVATTTVTGNTVISGTTLNINANTSIIGSTISLNANTSITGNSLDVGANTTFNSANVDINSTTEINGDLTVVGDITASGNVSITSTNTVINSTNTNISGTGANITTNNLNISANTTYTGRATFNGNATFAGSYANVATTDLVVGANSTFTASTLTANVDTFTIGQNSTDVLNINSTVDFNSDINVDGNQINTADLRIEGDLTVIGETFLLSNNALSINEGAITTLNVIDTLDMNLGATVISDIIPGANITYDLGSTGSRWDNIYAGTFVGNLDWTNVTSKPDPTISVALTGDVVGSGSTTLTNLTNGSISFSTTIQPNSVTLGTDTTGNYVQNLVAGTGVSLLNNTGEGATPTVSIGQNVATTSNVTFRNVTVSEDIVVSGNLIVEGTTTTINTNEVNIGDNIIVLNSDETGSPSQDAGFEVERGTSGNVSFLWDESLSRWTLGSENLVAGTFIGALSGNATTASSLQSARTISLGGDLSGSVSFNGSSNVTLNATVKANSVALGTDTTGNYAADVDAGSGINVSGSAGEGTVFTVSHADTSSQSSVNNSNGTVIQDIILDTYGHITSLGSVNLDTRFVRNTADESISGFKTFANTTILQSTTTGAAAAKIIKPIDDATGAPALIVATDGEADDIIAEFRANATGASVDTSDTGNSSDSVFQVFGTGNVNADGTITAAALTVQGAVEIGENGGGDSVISFYDDNSNTYRALRWSDTANDWKVEDNTGSNRVLYHSGNIPNATITIAAGDDLTGGGAFGVNQISNETITINHGNTSALNGAYGGNNDGVVIEDITVDDNGHVTAVGTRDLDTRFLGISAKAADANLLDGLNSTQFLRSDTDDIMSGTLQTTGLGVGTTAPTGGEIRATGDITAFYSDARLKDFKGTINNAVDKIVSINGYYYTANETAQNLGYTDELQVGVSAQEVQKVLPEVVVKAPISDREDVDVDYLTVKYEKLVPLLIEAIKELKFEIEQLKSKG